MLSGQRDFYQLLTMFAMYERIMYEKCSVFESLHVREVHRWDQTMSQAWEMVLLGHINDINLASSIFEQELQNRCTDNNRYLHMGSGYVEK